MNNCASKDYSNCSVLCHSGALHHKVYIPRWCHVGDLEVCIRPTAKAKVGIEVRGALSVSGAYYQSSISSRRHGGVLVIGQGHTMFSSPASKLISDGESRQ